MDHVVRPTPEIATRVVLTLPNLPDALIGCTVLHLSDFHVRRRRPQFQRILEQCQHLRADFAFFTGDYMSYPSDEPNALRGMAECAEILNPVIKHGIFASFGNHDYPAFRALAPQYIPNVHWMETDAVVLPDHELTIVGTSTPCDMLKGMTIARQKEREAGFDIDLDRDDDSKNRLPYRICLAHEPTVLITAADLGIEWTLAGHTHGGQLRLLPRKALHTSCDLPPKFASGILRFRDSICTVNRGLGETVIDFRLFCPPQILLYELRRGPLSSNQNTKVHHEQSYFDTLRCVRWW